MGNKLKRNNKMDTITSTLYKDINTTGVKPITKTIKELRDAIIEEDNVSYKDILKLDDHNLARLRELIINKIKD